MGENMASTVNIAFDEFIREKVNINQDSSKKARSSRDWLINKIHDFPKKDDTFPKLYNQIDIYFGSFARKTKIKPLDDIDIMIGISADGGTYYELNDSIIINIPETADKLRNLCNDDNNLSSVKVLNKFKKSLTEISQYEKAEINRNQEAITLKLSFYEWNFDIIPCFFTKPETSGRTYYLIPDGNGKWKKTDPRMDRDRVIKINQNNNGKVLNVIRLMKYWNKRPIMPSMPSYLIENMVLDYYETHEAKNYVDWDVKYLLEYIRDNIFDPVYDPKDIQGDINNLSQDEKTKIQNRADLDYDKAVLAGKFETNKDQKSAINKWKEIFGYEFPEYS